MTKDHVVLQVFLEKKVCLANLDPMAGRVKLDFLDFLGQQEKGENQEHQGQQDCLVDQDQQVIVCL